MVIPAMPAPTMHTLAVSSAISGAPKGTTAVEVQIDSVFPASLFISDHRCGRGGKITMIGDYSSGKLGGAFSINLSSKG